MKVITKQYFLDKVKSDKLKKKYIPGISVKILGDRRPNWESTCYFELSDKVFFLDYNLDSIFTPSSYEITEDELIFEKIDIKDWNLTHISDKPIHNKNNLHKALDWSCQYSIKEDKTLFERLLNIESGTWKLENTRINETLIFSIKIDVLFNSEIYLYIGIDELSIYPYVIEEVRNKIHFIKQIIEWKVMN